MPRPRRDGGVVEREGRQVRLEVDGLNFRLLRLTPRAAAPATNWCAGAKKD